MKTGNADPRHSAARRLLPQRGWTLIELGVVLLVIGVVVGVAAPRLGGFTESSRLTALEEEMLAISNSLDAYKRGGELATADGIRRTVKVSLPVAGPAIGNGTADQVISINSARVGLVNFSGESPLKTPYTLQITAAGASAIESDRHIIHVATCIPADNADIEFANPFLGLDCGDAMCPGACLVMYKRGAVPKKELTDIEAENELVYGSLPAPPPPPPPPPPGKCAAPDTPIATPDGEVAIASLRPGDLVLSLDHGELRAVPLRQVSRTAVSEHTIVRLTFADGRQLEMSPTHPTADGTALDRLAVGSALGSQTVTAVEQRPYTHSFTYDILPDSVSGTYVAAGALVGSTLSD